MLVLRKIQRDSISPTSTEWSLAFPSHHELNVKHHIHFDRCFKRLSVIDKPFLGPQLECVGVLHYWFPLTLELLWCPAILILLTLRVILQTTIPQFSQPQELIHSYFHFHTDNSKIFTVIPNLSSKLQSGISSNVDLEMACTQFKAKVPIHTMKYWAAV